MPGGSLTSPDLRVIVATGDSLIHGRGAPSAADTSLPGVAEPHYQWSEDIEEFADADLLGAASYHAVFGNPPYLTPKDKAESETYRAAYPACTGTYALTVPFIVRFFGLAIHGSERRIRLRRLAFLQQLHETGVRAQPHRAVLPDRRSYPRDRYLRSLHPRPRHTDGDPVRPEPAASARQQSG